MIFLQHIACGINSGMITANAQRESILWFRQALFSGIFIDSIPVILFLCLDYLVLKTVLLVSRASILQGLFFKTD